MGCDRSCCVYVDFHPQAWGVMFKVGFNLYKGFCWFIMLTLGPFSCGFHWKPEDKVTYGL